MYIHYGGNIFFICHFIYSHLLTYYTISTVNIYQLLIVTKIFLFALYECMNKRMEIINF